MKFSLLRNQSKKIIAQNLYKSNTVCPLHRSFSNSTEAQVKDTKDFSQASHHDTFFVK
jgi:hypothetical protein